MRVSASAQKSAWEPAFWKSVPVGKVNVILSSAGHAANQRDGMEELTADTKSCERNVEHSMRNTKVWVRQYEVTSGRM